MKSREWMRFLPEVFGQFRVGPQITTMCRNLRVFLCRSKLCGDCCASDASLVGCKQDADVEFSVFSILYKIDACRVASFFACRKHKVASAAHPALAFTRGMFVFQGQICRQRNSSKSQHIQASSFAFRTGSHNILSVCCCGRRMNRGRAYFHLFSLIRGFPKPPLAYLWLYVVGSAVFLHRIGEAGTRGVLRRVS